MKFKKGDRVVIVRIIANKDLPLGTVATIRSVTDNHSDAGVYDPGIYLKEDPDDNNYYTVKQVELEQIHNSPLNKALR